MTIQKAMAVLAIGAACLTAGPAVSQPAQTVFGPIAQPRTGAKPNPPIDPVLRQQLQDRLAKWASDAQTKQTTVIRWMEVPLPAGGREIVVYVSGGGDPKFGEMGGWCGTGGCRIYIFEVHGHHYGRVGSLQAWLPIRVLPERHGGHPDLSVWVQGGGIYPGYASRIAFHKGAYPMDGGQRNGGKVAANAGTLLLDDRQASAKLYP